MSFLLAKAQRQFALRHGFQPERLVDVKGLQWLQEHESGRNENTGHDTIGVIAIDTQGVLAAVCTTSGTGAKTPGRVGDSPIIGAGLYCDGMFGAAVATGHGEDILKVCASFLVVEQIRMGASPQEACQEAVSRIVEFAKRGAAADEALRTSAVIACNIKGETGAASTCPGFEYAYWDGETNRQIKAPNWQDNFAA